MPATIPASAADLMTPRQAADPYSLYRELREHTPFPATREGSSSAMWPLMKYHDVYGALKDHTTFSSGASTQPDHGAISLPLINDDPPRHTRFRKLVSKTFTPRRIADVEPWIKETSDALFASIGDGETDIVSNYTVPLPVKAIARILGIPGEEYQTFKRWTDALLSFSPAGEDAAYRLQQLQEMTAYFGKMVAARREHGSSDIITLLVEGDADGKLEDWEILGFATLLLVAGNETTTNLMGNMINHLANDPALYRRLREDRSLVDTAIEEMLRFESPVQVLFRKTLKDVTLPSGGFIPEGEVVGVYFGAANRDPEGWDDVDSFRLDRNLRDHVAFGMGIHYCLGSPLARAEARVTVNNLLDRYESVEPAGTGARQTSAPIVFGFQELPVRLG
jgi:hypothetical protein